MRPADVVKILLEKKYKLGGFKDGYDCLSLLLTFYESLGYKFPNEWKGWTRDNYAERWEKGEGRKELYKFLHGLGVEVDINYAIEGDLLILNNDIVANEMLVTSAIYLGNAHAILLSDVGIVVVPLWAIKNKIIEVRRLKCHR